MRTQGNNNATKYNVIEGSTPASYQDNVAASVTDNVQPNIFAVQVLPNLDINGDNNGKFVIQHGVNQKLYIGKYNSSDNKKITRWTFKDEAYLFEFSQKPEANC